LRTRDKMLFSSSVISLPDCTEPASRLRSSELRGSDSVIYRGFLSASVEPIHAVQNIAYVLQIKFL